MTNTFGSPEHLAHIRKTREIILSGFAGVLSNGNIVDRRERPDAIPIPENKMFGNPKPKSHTPK